jgi:hypothetical protein
VSDQPPDRLVVRAGRPSGTGVNPRELRICRRHGEAWFGLYSGGPEAPRKWRCTRCVSDAVTRRHQKVKLILVAEAGGCCAVCGYDRTVVNLHFHHVDPTLKSFAVNSSLGKLLADFRAEARKCVLVCANCHGEIEAGVISSPSAGTKFIPPSPDQFPPA